jgi:hypothetical protein
LNKDVKRVIEFVEKQTKEALSENLLFDKALSENLLFDKTPEIYVKLIWEEPEIEYEDVYETLPESEEGSIQVGEGWGPRVIGKKEKDLTFKFDEVIGDFLLSDSPT